jgi:DNA-binding CsgD family transcriptional regulator
MTPRVARLAAEGMRKQEIALKLNLGEHTLRNYLIRIFDKLSTSSRVELVLYALSGAEDVGSLSASSTGSAGLIA